MRRLLAVLGQDVSGSLSPVLHRAAARALEHEVDYVRISCRTTADFDAALTSLAAQGALGANVTMPYKTRAFARTGEHGPEADLLGAVNTIHFRPDVPGSTWRGDNTDAPGMLALLQRLPADRLECVQVLGAGGAARAVGWALEQAGAERIVVSARDPLAAARVARAALVTPMAARADATLIISALPKSLAARCLTEWITAPSATLIDLAYGGVDSESELVRGARARGLVAYDGRSLLIEQAARSFEIWTGGELSRIRRAMRDALMNRENASSKSPAVL